MNGLIVFESEFGNTEHIARAIAAKIDGAGTIRVLAASELNALDPHGIDLLIVGGPTQGHGISPKLRGLLDRLPTGSLDGITAAAFDTRLDWPRLLSGSAAGGIQKKLEEKGAWLPLEAASFIVKGKEGPLAEGELERAEAWATHILGKVAPVIAARGMG